MNEKPMDRRVRKTRALYRKCLVELMKKKKIQDISVREISELADLNRGTFIFTIKMYLIFWSKLKKNFSKA